MQDKGENKVKKKKNRKEIKNEKENEGKKTSKTKKAKNKISWIKKTVVNKAKKKKEEK